MSTGTSDTNNQPSETATSAKSNIIYRNEAVTRRGQRESIDGLPRVTAPHEWLIQLALLVAIIVLISWATLGEIQRGISTDCMLLYPGNRNVITSGTNGRVAEIFVQVGSVVEVDQPVARLRSDELDRQVRIAQARVEALEDVTDPVESHELRLARTDLRELAALRTEGQLIVSNVAGEVMAHELFVGRAIEPNDVIAIVRTADPGMIEAVALVSSENARRIELGMEARVGTSSAITSGDDVVVADVVEISNTPVHPPDWLYDLGLSSQHQMHLVKLGLRDQLEAQVADGSTCNARIIYERGSPMSVILP